MCTVSVATETAAAIASTPSQSAWFDACWNRYAAPMLSSTDRPMPQCTAEINSRAAALAQKGEADGDDEEGLEAFPEGDHECLQHAMCAGSVKMRISLSLESPAYATNLVAGK